MALSKPDAETMDIGKDILFPTEHIERIIAHAKEGGGTMEARVYDGSDTGKKVFQTLTVIGKEATTPTPESDFADTLGKVRRWPVTVSYFDEKARDAPPEYILTFDLYENGVSGTLKLDYGAFALKAKLKRLDLAADSRLRPTDQRGSPAAARPIGEAALHRRRAESVAQARDRRFARFLAAAVALDEIGRVGFRGRREVAPRATPIRR